VIHRTSFLPAPDRTEASTRRPAEARRPNPASCNSGPPGGHRRFFLHYRADVPGLAAAVAVAVGENSVMGG
jgi:hypothetical protein